MSLNPNNLNYNNFRNICRMCMLPCAINFKRDAVIMKIFHKLTDLHFEQYVELPQQICIKCFDKVNEIHQFSVLCKQTHFTLIECLNTQRNMEIKEQEILNERNELLLEPIDESNEDDVQVINETNIQVEIKEESNSINDLIDLFNENSNASSNGEDNSNTSVTDNKNEYKCETCNTSFFMLNLFEKHECRSMHSGEHHEYLYKCDECEKSFVHLKSLKYHKRGHSGEQHQYKCNQCEKTFTQSGSLVVHKRTHSGERPYKCDECDKAFNTSGTLKVHKRIHSGERPYKCDECQKSFINRSTFHKHNQLLHNSEKLVHSSEQSHKCDQCDKSFKYLSKLVTHKQVHSGEKPFKCDECGKSFSLRYYLKNHQRVHSGEQQHKCDRCKRLYSSAASLEKHSCTAANKHKPK